MVKMPKHSNTLKSSHFIAMTLYSLITSRTVIPEGIIGSTCSW